VSETRKFAAILVSDIARLLFMKVLRVIDIMFLSALLLAGEGGSAGALTVSCAPAQTLGGGNRQAPGNEAISATVSHASGTWSIRYVFANGSTVSREQQYTIADESDFSYPTDGTAGSTKTRTRR
jgi:hypothetical protein